MTTLEASRAAASAVGDAIVLAARTVVATARRIGRTASAVITASRKHLPRWANIALTIALALAVLIPGPQDELLVLLILGVFAAFKRQMRRDIATAARKAWKGE